MALPSPNRFARPNLAFRLAAGTRAAPAPAPVVAQEARRETRVRDDITNIQEGRKLYSQSVNLPSVAANTTTSTDVTTAEDTCRTGDYVDFIGAEIANHGYVVLGCLPCPSNDTIRLRVANNTAGTIDPSATTLYFVIHRTS